MIGIDSSTWLAYVCKPFANAVKELLGAEVQMAKRGELHTEPAMPLCRVAERSFA